MEVQDKRLQTTNEILNSIKLIKINAWENYFLDKLFTKRN